MREGERLSEALRSEQWTARLVWRSGDCVRVWRYDRQAYLAYPEPS